METLPSLDYDDFLVNDTELIRTLIGKKVFPMIAQTYPCPQCGKTLSSKKPRLAGTKMRCPKCQTVFPWLGLTEIVREDRPSVFISHSHLDRAFVEKDMRNFLNEHGISPWWSSDNIQTGEDWKNKIYQGLNTSEWIMVIMSQRSEESEWVRREMAWAFENRPHQILPVLLGPCDSQKIHPKLATVQNADYGNNPQDAKRRILNSLISQVNKDRLVHKNQASNLTRQKEVLEQENKILDAHCKQLQANIRSAVEFDGNWSSLPTGPIPEFIPLVKRGTPIISLFNLKGGVGKSTLTANIGATLWGPAFLKKVLLIDLDYQGSLSQICFSPSTIQRMRLQGRTSDVLFKGSETEIDTISRLAEPIKDDQQNRHDGQAVCTDEDLFMAETKAFLRWLHLHDAIDVRYRLRKLLHTQNLSQRHDFIFFDCPPRLTTGSVNALMASDFILIPTIIDELSLESVPRLLKWIKVRKTSLFPHLQVLGVVVNRTRQTPGLVNREKEELDALQVKCDEAWESPMKIYPTFIPTFLEETRGNAFPAHHAKLKGRFQDLCQDFLWDIQKQIQPKRQKV